MSVAGRKWPQRQGNFRPAADMYDLFIDTEGYALGGFPMRLSTAIAICMVTIALGTAAFVAFLFGAPDFLRIIARALGLLALVFGAVTFVGFVTGAIADDLSKKKMLN